MKPFSEYLTEAVEQLDELSKKTLGSYIKAASDDNEDNAIDTYKNHKKGSYQKLRKRKRGIESALNKLTGKAKVSAKD